MLSLLILLPLLLDVLALLLHLVDHVPVELLLVVEAVAALLHADEGLRLFALHAGGGAALGSHADVFRDEVLGSKVLHIVSLEIVGFDVLLLIDGRLPLLDDLFELIADQVCDVLEGL